MPCIFWKLLDLALGDSDRSGLLKPEGGGVGGNFLAAGGGAGNLQAPWEEENLLEKEEAGLGVGVDCGEKRVPSLDLLSAPPRVVEEHGPEVEKVLGGIKGGDLEVEEERGEDLGGEEEAAVEGLGPSLSFTVEEDEVEGLEPSLSFTDFPAFLAIFSSNFSCHVFFLSGT